MRGAAAALALAAALLLGARLFTGVVYAVDAPIAYLVVHGGPALWITRGEAEAPPRPRGWVLDQEEPDLAYRALYVGLMRWAPVLAGLCLAGAGLAWRRGRARTTA